jgi:hypothetical protein
MYVAGDKLMLCTKEWLEQWKKFLQTHPPKIKALIFYTYYTFTTCLTLVSSSI